MKVGYHTVTWGGVVGDARGVTSVKDLYYRSHGCLLDAIRDIGSAGYQGIEVFDGNLLDYESQPTVLRDALEAAGLELASVYSGGNLIFDDIRDEELWRITNAARVAASFGATNLVVGGGARRASATTEQDYDKLGAALDRVTEIAERFGLHACYHPHLSTIVESPEELETIMKRTRVGFCPDTAHLAAGGGDPADLIRRFGDRMQHLHLKDLRTEPVAFVPLGAGVLEFGGILSAVRDVGFDGWIVVELDSYDGDPLTAAKASKDYLDAALRATR